MKKSNNNQVNIRYPFAEPDELFGMAHNILESLSSGVREETKIIDDFMSQICRGIAFTLSTNKVIPKNLAATIKKFKNLNEIIEHHLTEDDLDLEIQLLEFVTLGYDIESCLDEGNIAKALPLMMQLTTKLVEKKAIYSADRIKWSDFEPLKGKYPEVLNMHPSSMAGRCISVITQSRNIWQNNENEIPNWKIDIGIRLKHTSYYVFQYAEKYGNSFKESNFQTSENPMTHLCCQLDTELVLNFARGRGARAYPTVISKEIRDSEIYSIYAILYAFEGLQELQHIESENIYPDDNWEERWSKQYLAEAEGFLSQAKTFLANESAKIAVSEQNKSSRISGTEKKINALIEGLRSICKEMGKVPTEKEIQHFLMTKENSTFFTNLIICPKMWRGDTVKDGKIALFYEYRESNSIDEAVKKDSIAFGTYKREYKKKLWLRK